MTTVLLLALRWFYNILTALILIRVFGSWFVQNPYGSRWYMALVNITEPILGPCRQLISRFQAGMRVDFSPVVALLLMTFIYRILCSLIIMIFR
ncbi:MAG: YggT family protein [Firmicutes bacterium]|jgi:YggT family protein|nr:YggT family protein [Bacillota bacterium]